MKLQEPTREICRRSAPNGRYLLKTERRLTGEHGLLFGDADGDGRITILDAALIQKRLAELSSSGNR